MEERDELVISPKVIIDVIKKNIVFIIITVLLFSLCSFFYTKFFITKQYTSNMSLYVETVESADVSQTASANISMRAYAQQMVATYIRMLNTRNFYNELADNLNNKYTAGELSGMIKFKSDDETEVFDVSIVSSSPSESKRIGDAIAEIAPERLTKINSKAVLKICDDPSTPSGPSSPNTTKNVLYAFIAGLGLSLVIAFIRHIADKKIRYTDEMTEIDGIPVLAAIPNFDNYIGNKKTRR